MRFVVDSSERVTCSCTMLFMAEMDGSVCCNWEGGALLLHFRLLMCVFHTHAAATGPVRVSVLRVVAPLARHYLR